MGVGTQGRIGKPAAGLSNILGAGRSKKMKKVENFRKELKISDFEQSGEEWSEVVEFDKKKVGFKQ